MDAPLAVLLRDGTHANATTRFALKAEQLTIAPAKTPIQVPVPRGTPILMDLGSTRPSITLSGVVENIGGDTTNTDSNFFHMEKMTVSGQSYYVPYKNFFENKLITWVSGADVTLELEIGDASVVESSIDASTPSTGGGVYEVAVQQCQFSVMPAMEDRWTYNLQFVAKLRNGIAF